MELGVDIGGLTAVTMNNVPPHPANFLQRTGRAGRRGETSALSFTLCKSTPHGEAVFRNPLWPFNTPVSVPQVSLQSRPIIQRHVNSLVLSAFLAFQNSDNIMRLSCGWFFEPGNDDESAPWYLFYDWCKNLAASEESLVQGIPQVVKRTVLGGMTIANILNRTAEMIEQAAQKWLAECRCLLENLEIVKTKKGNSKTEVAVSLQLERIRREYLLGELAGRNFLPSYGFASGLACLVTTTMEQIERRKKGDIERREDNLAVRAGYPSRSLPIAILDYAPGTDTVLDGRVYRSAGLTLNWQLPAELEGPPEIQSLRWAWRCDTCRGNGTHQDAGSPIPHKRLRGGKDNDSETACPGSHERWAIKANLRLGGTIHTDVLELQLNHLDGYPINNVTAYSLSVALKRALSRQLGIEKGELGSIITPTRNEEGHPVSSIHIYDVAQGGAGYVNQALPQLSDLLRNARKVLECPRKCDAACQACLLTYDTQYHQKLLDRNSALALLEDRYLHALTFSGTRAWKHIFSIAVASIELIEFISSTTLMPG